jgi:ketosteroid isomerase-like protein
MTDLLWRERDIDAALALLHPDADIDFSDSRAPYRGHYRGHVEIRKLFHAMADAWDRFYPEFTETIEVDPQTVLVVTLVRARGKGSGIPVEARGAGIWSVRDGKIIRGKLFQSKAEAMEAIGE